MQGPPGTMCKFPYVYQGKKFYDCIETNHNQPWCATTSSYDRDKKWGDCMRKFLVHSFIHSLCQEQKIGIICIGVGSY